MGGGGVCECEPVFALKEIFLRRKWKITGIDGTKNKNVTWKGFFFFINRNTLLYVTLFQRVYAVSFFSCFKEYFLSPVLCEFELWYKGKC